MRRYEIKITDQDGEPKTVKGSLSQGDLFNGTFTSTGLTGGTIPGALNVEMDLPVSVYNSPLGGAFLRVYGVGLPLMQQAAANFNPSADGKKYCNIEISGGMAKGLPLANPKQYGILMTAKIQQAFANWQGTSQTLDFILQEPSGILNAQFKCELGKPLAPSIKNALQIAVPTAKQININVSPALIAPGPLTAQYYNLTQFSMFLNNLSKSIINKTNYPGIQLSYENNVINVFDYTVPNSEKPVQIQFEELIGQPTWLAPYTLTFKTPMRKDLKVGSKIKMPERSAKLGLVLTAAASQSQSRDISTFSGDFQVQSVRHLGMFRQPDANSWVTVVQAYFVPKDIEPVAIAYPIRP